MEINNKFIKLKLFLVLFTITFGPKIFGVLDLIVLFPAIIVGLYIITIQKIYRTDICIKILAAFALFIIWLMLSFIFNSNFELQPILRILRALMSSLLIVQVLVYFSKSKKLELIAFIDIFLMVLSTNCIAIIIQIIFPASQVIFSEIWGFDKNHRLERAFGLTTGYDSAGYLSILVASISLIIFFRLKKYFYFTVFILSSAAIFFTSRSAMLLYLLIVSGVVFINLFNLKLLLKLMPIVISLCYLTFNFVFPRVFSGIVEFQFLLGSSDVDFTSNFATTSIASVIYQMLVIPTGMNFIFGSGVLVDWSDIGYIKILHLGGFPLLIITILFYILFCFSARSAIVKLIRSDAVSAHQIVTFKILFDFLILFLLIMLVGNIKNLYFFTRTYHEIFIIILSLLLISTKDKSSSLRFFSKNK